MESVVHRRVPESRIAESRFVEPARPLPNSVPAHLPEGTSPLFLHPQPRISPLVPPPESPAHSQTWDAQKGE
jgi:hypothetical protein